MNTKRKLTKWTSIIVLVAIASLATAGLVLADHDTPVVGVEVSSKTYFDQYNAAIEHMERDRQAAFAALINARNSSAVSFDQYNAAIEQAELDRNTAFTNLANASTSSAVRFDQYNAAIKQAELDRNAAFATPPFSQSDDSRLRWEQYLKYAK